MLAFGEPSWTLFTCLLSRDDGLYFLLMLGHLIFKDLFFVFFLYSDDEWQHICIYTVYL